MSSLTKQTISCGSKPWSQMPSAIKMYYIVSLPCIPLKLISSYIIRSIYCYNCVSETTIRVSLKTTIYTCINYNISMYCCLHITLVLLSHFWITVWQCSIQICTNFRHNSTSSFKIFVLWAHHTVECQALDIFSYCQQKRYMHLHLHSQNNQRCKIVSCFCSHCWRHHFYLHPLLHLKQKNNFRCCRIRQCSWLLQQSTCYFHHQRLVLFI